MRNRTRLIDRSSRSLACVTHDFRVRRSTYACALGTCIRMRKTASRVLRNSCERITFACGSRASRISACDRYIRMRDLLECCGICASVSPSHAELVRYALRASLRMRNRPIRMRKRHSQETRMRISCGRMKIFFRDTTSERIETSRSVVMGYSKSTIFIISISWHHI